MPANCFLTFEGGSIVGGHLSGSVKNDFLDVSNFTRSEVIDDALAIIHAICDCAYIPKGVFKLDRKYPLGTYKTIKGCGLSSQIILSEDAYFYINRKENVTIEDVNISMHPKSTNPAIWIDGIRYGRMERISIQSSKIFTNYNNQTGLLIRQSKEDRDNYGCCLSSFNQITISNVRYGIVLDCSVVPERDYITSCVFSDILIYSFCETGLLIKGKRIYYNTFDNITIQDNYSSNKDRKGIEFCGGFANKFNNLTTWADARHGTHNFYTLWFATDCGVVAMPTHITGNLEGLIGSPASEQAKYIFLSRCKYDLNISMVDSPSNNILYSGRLTNESFCDNSFVNLLNFSDFYRNFKYEKADKVFLNNKGLTLTRYSKGDITIKVPVSYSIVANSRLKLLLKADSEQDIDVTLYADGNAVEKKLINKSDGTIGRLTWTNTLAPLLNNVDSMEIVIKAKNTRKLTIQSINLVSYNSEYEYPWYVFTNSEYLLQQIPRYVE